MCVPQSHCMSPMGKLPLSITHSSLGVWTEGTASATVSMIRASSYGNDKAMGIRIDGIYLAAGFLLIPLPLDMGMHVVECVGCEQYIPKEVRVEKNSVAHGKGRSINKPL